MLQQCAKQNYREFWSHEAVAVELGGASGPKSAVETDAA